MYAAANGHLEVLQWARAQKQPCPWDEGECLLICAGQADIIEWLREHEDMHEEWLDSD